LKESLYDLHEKIEDKHWWFKGRRQILYKLIAAIAPPKKSLTLVNVGCGTGGDLSFLSSSYRCIGIDSSSRALAAAEKCAPKASVILGSNFEAVPPRQKGECRVWLFLDVLEHIKEELDFFSGFSNIFEVGEKIIITVPANPKLWSSHDESFGHYRRYTEESLKRIWNDLPFKIILLSRFNSRLYPLIWLIRSIKNKIGKKTGQKETDFFLLPSALNSLLYKIFCGEHKRILGIMDGDTPYYYGTSLIAVLARV
jgi:hypothetical protein